MSVSAVSHFVTTTARLALPHYIKGTAAAITVFGGIWAGKRRWNLSYYEKLDAASTRVKAKLEIVTPELSTWNNGNAHDAKELLQILYDVCAENNPLPHLEFVGPGEHFQKAVDHVKTLTTVAEAVSKAQDKWLKETKEKAGKWLKDTDKLGGAVNAKLLRKKDVQPIFLANRLLVLAVIDAKEEIKEEENVTAGTIQQQMALVKTQYEALYELVGKSDVSIKKWFPDDGYGDLKDLSDAELTNIFTAQGKIKGDDKTDVNKAIAGLAHEKLLNAVNRNFTNEKGIDSAAKTADIEFHKWNQDGNGLYNPLLGCTAAALAILAVNWGAPHYLGADHRFVQLFKLPS